MYAPDAQEIWELVNAQRFHPYTSDLPAPTPLVSDPDGTAEPPRPATWDDPDPVWDEEAQMWVAGHSAPAHEGAAARLRRDRRRRARSLLPVHSNGRVAAALLSLGAVLGVIVGAVLLATVPTPLDLASASAQARAYAATIGIVGGATAALFAVTLLVHVPALPSSSADPVRVR